MLRTDNRLLCVLSFAVALLCPLVAGCGDGSDGTGSTVEGPAWNHDPADATRGPAAWGEVDAGSPSIFASG